MVKGFEDLVERRDSGALVVSAGQRVTRADIDRLSRTVAAQHLTGLPSGTLIGLAIANGPAFLGGLLAIWRSGSAALLLDVTAPVSDIARTTDRFGSVGILQCTKAWPDSADDFHFTPAAAGTNPISLPHGAVVKLTSGSTGLPKGVLMTADNLLADEAALASTMGLREDDHILSTLPWSHSYGFTSFVLSAVVRGLPLILPSGDGPLSPLVDGQRLGATVFPTVPAYPQALLRMSSPPPFPDSMRLVMTAGAPLDPESARRFRVAYGQPIHVFYGSSECGGICYDREGSAGERGTVGTPVDGVRVSLVPAEGLASETGRITVESAAVATGYLPVGDRALHDGRFETSDLGTWRNGELVLGLRIGRTVNIRGRKVDPFEVECVLAALPGVSEAAVFGVAVPGSSAQQLRAVIATPEGAIAHADVVAWCRSQLAAHKVPRSIILVDALPRTPRGKVDRAALCDWTRPDSPVETRRG